MTEARHDGAWPVTWDANRRRQLREMAGVPIAQRVEWLEERLDEARRSGALERACRRRDGWIELMWGR